MQPKFLIAVLSSYVAHPLIRIINLYPRVSKACKNIVLKCQSSRDIVSVSIGLSITTSSEMKPVTADMRVATLKFGAMCFGGSFFLQGINPSVLKSRFSTELFFSKMVFFDRHIGTDESRVRPAHDVLLVDCGRCDRHRCSPYALRYNCTTA